MPSVIGTVNGVDVAANFQKNVRANGLGPRTVVATISKSNITDAELNAVINALTSSGGEATYNSPDLNGPDAFVVAGLAGDAAGAAFVAGTTGVVYVALQGTGTLLTGADVGVVGATVAVIATFDQNYQ
jgi:hypothetical protein